MTTDVTVLTIDQLPSASFVGSTNLIPLLQGGVTKSASLQVLSNSVNMLPLGSYVAASDLIQVVQGDNIARQVPAKAIALSRGIVWADGYNFLPGNSAAANTTALGNIATAINALGAATLIIPPGTYNVTVPVGGTVCSLSNLTGLVVIAPGVVIADGQNYSGVQTGTLFRLSACTNWHFLEGLKLTSQNVGINTYGCFLIYAQQGCTGFSVACETDGGLSGVQMNRLFNDPDSYRCRHYKLFLKCNNTHYAVVGAFSGDDGEVHLDATGSTRAFFYYGCDHIKLFVRAKNTLGTSIIGAYNGYGVDDFTLDYYDVESTLGSGLPVINIAWNDQTAATIKDIRVHVNLKAPATTPFTYPIQFYKLDNGGSADTTGRGHHFENFTLSGSATLTAGTNHINQGSGAFASSGTPDVAKGLRVVNYVGSGDTVTDDWSGFKPILTDSVVYENANYTNIDASAGSQIIGNKVLINPVSTGTVDNVTVGGGTAKAGTFTSVTSTGLVDISGASAGQIAFPATQNASAGANTLDDYEEGTMTLTLGGNATYTLQTGNYTKIARLVYVFGALTVNALGTGSTTTISGLPFTSVNSGGANAAGAVAYFASLAVNVITPFAYLANSATSVSFRSLTAAAATTSGDLAIFGNSARIDFSMTYHAAT